MSRERTIGEVRSELSPPPLRTIDELQSLLLRVTRRTWDAKDVTLPLIGCKVGGGVSSAYIKRR